MKDEEKEKKCKCENCHCEEENGECNCGENCDCGENCNCGESCSCNDDCDCGCKHEKCDCKHDECDCHDNNCDCDDCQKTKEEVDCENEIASTYLNMAQRLQADFDNYRKQTEIKLMQTFTRGQSSIIEAFFPCLDMFKKAKQSISDKNVLQGVEMIEKQILDTLKSQGVEKINTVGEKYDAHFHNAIAVMKNEDYENDVILEEFEAGYMFKGQVLRYAKVIVNKID